DLQISSTPESEYNSDNSLKSLEDNSILIDDLENNNNDMSVNSLENKNEHQPVFAKFGQKLIIDQVEYYLKFQEYPKTS
ncbi:24911_t:CDS:2, partial [Racocetra persica]